MRATVWHTVGPEWPRRSAIRARSGTMPSSSSSKMVRRYISVVSMRSVTWHSLSPVPDTVLWLRRDLRLADHPALVAAPRGRVRRLGPAAVRPRPRALGRRPVRRGGPGCAASLRALHEQYDGALVIRHGSPATVLPQLAREVGAASVHISAESTPFGRRRDERVREALGRDGRRAGGHRHAVRRGPGHADHRRRHAVPGVHPLRPRLAGARLAAPGRRRRATCAGPAGSTPRTCPRPATACPTCRPPASRPRCERWHAFLDEGIEDYAERRDRPDLAGTSDALGVAEVRRGPPAHAAGRPRRRMPRPRPRARRRSRPSWPGASSTPTCCGTGPTRAWGDLKQELAVDGVRRPGRAPRAARGVAGGAHRLPVRGRRDAPAAGRGMGPQPGADDRGQLPGQGPAHLVAARRPALPALPARRRHRLQQPRLAVGGRAPAPTRRRTSASSTRSRRGAGSTPTATTCAATCPSWRTWPAAAAHEPWKAADGYAHGYPEPIVDHAHEREVALERYAAAGADGPAVGRRTPPVTNRDRSRGHGGADVGRPVEHVVRVVGRLDRGEPAPACGRSWLAPAPGRRQPRALR